MSVETIDAQLAVKLFHQLMNSSSAHRILLVEGSKKLGKTHLVTKLFPTIGKDDYKSCCVLIDLRSRPLSIPEILMQMAAQVRKEIALDNFDIAYEKWLRKEVIKIEGTKAIFSQINININSYQNKAGWEMYLTQKLVSDIGAASQSNILLLIDQADSANKSIKTWLRETLLVQLHRLGNIRIVVSGRSKLSVLHIYNLVCITHKLRRVNDETEYVNWCRKIGIGNELLVDQSIKDFARLLDYSPGLFADLIKSAYRK